MIVEPIESKVSEGWFDSAVQRLEANVALVQLAVIAKLIAADSRAERRVEEGEEEGESAESSWESCGR